MARQAARSWQMLFGAAAFVSWRRISRPAANSPMRRLGRAHSASLHARSPALPTAAAAAAGLASAQRQTRAAQRQKRAGRDCVSMRPAKAWGCRRWESRPWRRSWAARCCRRRRILCSGRCWNGRGKAKRNAAAAGNLLRDAAEIQRAVVLRLILMGQEVKRVGGGPVDVVGWGGSQKSGGGKRSDCCRGCGSL